MLLFRSSFNNINLPFNLYTGSCTSNTCANRCGYNFANKDALQTAISGYPSNQANYGEMRCWDVSSITDLSQLFLSSSLNEPIGCWDVSKVTNMESMFEDATSFNQNIGNWNVSKVSTMRWMFYNAIKFNQSIANWNAIKVTDMREMFHGATNFNQDLCAWYNKLKRSTLVNDMFLKSGCTNPASPDFTTKSSFCQTCKGKQSLFSIFIQYYT